MQSLELPASQPARRQPEQPPSIIDRFLQPRNIKWVHAIGVMILLGSSLMLVLQQWASCTPLWKYLIMMAYVVCLYGASQVSYHRMVLRTTGTVLMGLFVVTLPLLYVALYWVGNASRSPLTAALLLPPTIALTLHGAQRIFKHFLRRQQTTFLGCYTGLCVAGYAVPLLPASLAPVYTVALWALLAAGAIKVSRRVFWLVEAHSFPRVAGFFPIALLGGQFLLVFCLHLASSVAVPWFGLGCVMTSVPLLITVDAHAKAFALRTGDLVRPFPATIMVPLIMALILCAAGLSLAAVGLGSLRDTPPLAMTPTSALAALVLALVARRVGRRGFAWCALLCALVAYNFSPAFFAQAAQRLVASSAAAVQENRLPFAFYGLTYVPAIVGLMLLWRRTRHSDHSYNVMARPAIQLAVGTTLVLATASWTHGKAVFVVGITMALLLGVQTFVTRKRALAAASIAVATVATAAVPYTVRTLLGVSLSFSQIMLLFIAYAGVLLVAGIYVVDPWLAAQREAERPNDSGRDGLPWLQAVSMAIVGFLVVAWVLLCGPWYAHPPLGAHPLPDVTLAALLFVHAARWRKPWLSAAAIAFAHAVIYGWLHRTVSPGPWMLSIATAALIVQWLVCSWALSARSVRHRVSERFQSLRNTFAPMGRAMATAALTVLIVFVHVPVALYELCDVPQATEIGRPLAPLLVGAVLCAWSCIAARRSGNPFLGGAMVAAALATISGAFVAVFGQASWPWLPVATNALALLVLPLLVALGPEPSDTADTEDRWYAVRSPMETSASAIIWLTAVGSLAFLTWPARVAGLLSVIAMWAYGRASPRPDVLSAACVGNWHLIVGSVFLGTPVSIVTLPQLLHYVTQPLFSAVLLPAAFIAAVGLLVPWQRFVSATRDNQDIDRPQIHRAALRSVISAAVAATLLGPIPTTTGLLLAAAVFAIALYDRVVAALATGCGIKVWQAQAVVAAALVYFIVFGVIEVGRGYSMFALVGASVLLLCISAWAAPRTRWQVLADPLSVTASWLPVATGAIAVFRHVGGNTLWLGHNSLALLLCAGLYFFRAWQQRRPWLFVASAALFNVSLALVWRELHLGEPQLYMIPIGASILALTYGLQSHVARSLHQPLYYAGALCIIVSPTFHIVSGSWTHLLSLMICSAVMVLAAIALRVRALVYTGTAFLAADLVAMVVHGSLERPGLLWGVGLLLGAAIVTLGAVAERNRELLLQRMRALQAVLATWS